MAAKSIPEEEVKRLKGLGFLNNKDTDNFSARVITGCGRVTADTLRALADAADAYGDGHIVFADGIDAQTSEYYNNVNWQMPNQFIARIWEGDSLDLWERMQNYNDNALASKAMGFTFDNSDVSGEYTALTNAYSEFQRQLELGFMNPDEGIPQLVERLKAAGLDDYIAEKQAQLNAWAEANGIQ